MTIPEEVREALGPVVVKAMRTADKVSGEPLEWEDLASVAVDTVLAHLEQVGWRDDKAGVMSRLGTDPLSRAWRERVADGRCEPVYCIRKEAPQ